MPTIIIPLSQAIIESILSQLKLPLDAIQQGYEDEYLSSFHGLTGSIETFLTNEIGSIKLNHNVNKVKELIQSFQEQPTGRKARYFRANRCYNFMGCRAISNRGSH